jgi:hypothetical protein
VHALVTSVPAGKYLLAHREMICLGDVLKAWGRVNGVKASVRRITFEEDAALDMERAETFAFVNEYGYDGGDPEIVHAKDVSGPFVPWMEALTIRHLTASRIFWSWLANMTPNCSLDLTFSFRLWRTGSRSKIGLLYWMVRYSEELDTGRCVKIAIFEYKLEVSCICHYLHKIKLESKLCVPSCCEWSNSVSPPLPIVALEVACHVAIISRRILQPNTDIQPLRGRCERPRAVHAPLARYLHILVNAPFPRPRQRRTHERERLDHRTRVQPSMRYWSIGGRPSPLVRPLTQPVPQCPPVIANAEDQQHVASIERKLIDFTRLVRPDDGDLLVWVEEVV